MSKQNSVKPAPAPAKPAPAPTLSGLLSQIEKTASPAPIPVIQKAPQVRWFKLSSPYYGLAAIDPTTGSVYTTNPTPVADVSAWMKNAVDLGILIEV